METELELSVTADSQARQRLKVAGSLTLPHAVRFKEALVACLEVAREVTLDISGMTSMDLSALQLICAAHRTAQRKGKPFTVEGGSAGYRTYLANAGLPRRDGCACGAVRACLWRDQ
ncbi:MAG TPA: STAS domain-containing protein [Geomonas sp.]|nr:STAS domain-containing protein [Geomonas sp.]